MRSLIRPALFMAARLGLLCSVIACVFGQTWQGSGFIYNLGAAIDNAGISVAIHPAATGLGIREQLDEDIVKSIIIGNRLPLHYSHLSLGPIGILYGPKGCVPAARHWLIITIFALFNGVLMFMYRKRPDV